MAGVIFTFHVFFALGGIFWEGGLDFYLGLCSPRNVFRHGGSVLRAVFLVLPRPPPDTIAVDFTFFPFTALHFSPLFASYSSLFNTIGVLDRTRGPIAHWGYIGWRVGGLHRRITHTARLASSDYGSETTIGFRRALDLLGPTVWKGCRQPGTRVGWI